jgi:hypothetical protein
MKTIEKKNEDLCAGDIVVFDDEPMKIQSIQLYLNHTTDPLFGMVTLAPGVGFVLRRGGYTRVVEK